MEEFGRNKQESRTEYRKLIRGVSGKEKDFLEDLKYGVILGSDKFVKWVQNQFVDRTGKRDRELPQKKNVSDDGILEKVIDEIAHNYKIRPPDLILAKSLPNKSRKIFIIKK